MNYIKKFIYSTALGVIALSSCNKDSLKDMNINPQAQNTINVNFLLTSAQLGAASGGSRGDNRYIDWRTNIGMASTAMQQLAAIGDISNTGDKYFHNPETAAAPWEFIYSDQLKNLGDIITQTSPGGFAEGQSNNTKQAARILRAFLFHRLTDLYGSIPYTEALQAANGIFFPKYDKQKVIYADLLKELDEATAALSGNDGDFAAADIYYNGDITKWKRWGNSLMLRLAMRLSNVDRASADRYVAKAVAGGVMLTNADNAVVPMAIGPSLWTNQNGISRAFYPGDGGNQAYLSKTFVDWMKGTSATTVTDDDPRISVINGGIGIWSATGTGSTWNSISADPLAQKGMPNGNDLQMLKAMEANPNLDPNVTYSKINPKLLDRDDPYVLQACAEVRLLLAEAAQRGIGGLTAAQAETYYREGVTAAMTMYTIFDASLTVTPAQISAYLTARPFNVWKPALTMIGEQLWASHFLNWYEAWAGWKRTGIPALTPTNYPGNVTAGRIPQRLMYPTSEVAGNPNFATGASANDYTTRVWWAGGPE